MMDSQSQRLLTISFAVTFVFFCNFAVGRQNGTLIYTIVVHRHGERTPLELYPTDPHKADTWPIGLEQLTNEGKQTLYDLGLFLKKRYGLLLGDKYNVSTITAISSDKDRTIMSIQCLLAAMYPPMGLQIWNEHISWQPIPVHTIPNDDDNVLALTKSCPKYDKDVHDLKNIPEVREILDHYHDLMTYVSDHSGFKMTNYGVEDFKNISSVYDILAIEIHYNLSQPTWVTKSVIEDLHQMVPISFNLYHYTPSLQRFTSGVLLKEIIYQLINKTNRNQPLVKNVTIYSGHDSTIVGLLCALKSYNMQQPPYGSAMLFELHKYDPDEYVLKIFYRNETGAEPYELNLPDCPTPCTLEMFALIIDPLLPQDWNKECQITTIGVVSNSLTYVAAAVIIVLIITVIFVRCFLKRTKSVQTGYISYS